MQNPALIRPIGLAETDNILRSLDWSDSPTLDFVAEGRAHIWDNAAIEGSAATLVDGDEQTSSGDRFKGLAPIRRVASFSWTWGLPFRSIVWSTFPVHPFPTTFRGPLNFP